MFAKLAVSVATSFFLSQTPAAIELMQNWEKTNITASSKKLDYEQLSYNVCYFLKLATYQITHITTQLQDYEKKEFQDFLNTLKQAKAVAKKRIQKNNLECDKNVYYSLLASSHILEALLDDEFFALTGGYKMPQDFLGFGKGLA
ncbi:hypothetical protein CQA49_00075 [Helicobacter sp. MIT 00-7814]|uniref:hypothetical protein n=1 Tax=unclassified Helicobacter TaxID=2593540 RepID=UPI000E1EB0D9|nr:MULTISPECIES: hypothetical protein [unclassified Helicobacter]RDU57101.1 hypothetical protein CQA49_00075 [Helicobacter sp. MIT 00-7814]RDU57652.1 hypothetical protein CQA37_00075 [Helicobacter sp. MIT 99-10781]